MTSAGLINLF